MEEILFRSFRKTDIKDLQRLIGDAWYPEDAFSDKRLRKDLIALEATYTLIASDWKLVAEMEGEVKAVIFGRLSKPRAFWKNFLRFFPLLGLFLKLLIRSRASRRALAEELDYSRAMRRLKRGRRLGRTTECTLFIVHSDLRGKGIGKRLMQDFTLKAKQARKTNIHLFTDTSCNYGFYDAYGFRRLASCEMTSRTDEDENETFEVYLYTMDVR